MPHIYQKVDGLQRSEHVDGGDCVALIKAYAPGLAGVPTLAWRAGAHVVSTSGLARGTAIATFVDGRYPQNGRTGKHAAFLLAVMGHGIWVMDQWKDDPAKPRVSRREIPRLGRNSDGSFKNPSNNADAFFVIER